MKKIRWGIVGTGAIANIFAFALKTLKDAELVGIASRAQETADAFGDDCGIPRRYVGAAALAADPEVDVIYIATPHPFHKNDTLTCLNAGKAVLCEKPFAMNAEETSEMFACARTNRRFLMEAMWTHFLPAIQKTRELVASGEIGDVRILEADIGFTGDWDPKGRLLNPALGGGALLDPGVYVVSMAHMIFGRPPLIIDSQARICETGVDDQATMLFGYEKGAMAILACAFRAAMGCRISIYGFKGRIMLPNWRPEELIVCKGRDEQTFTFDSLANHHGYTYQAVEVMRCLRAGERESPVMPADKTLAIMKTMDDVRARWSETSSYA